jgi:hypothetical protein
LRSPWLPTANPARNFPSTMKGSQTSSASSTVSTTDTLPRHKSVCGSYRALASPPHLFVNGILCGNCTVEGRILTPCASHVAKITLLLALSGEASPPRQGFNGYLVQALHASTQEDVLFRGTWSSWAVPFRTMDPQPLRITQRYLNLRNLLASNTARYPKNIFARLFVMANYIRLAPSFVHFIQ